ncbi:MAG: B-box zinc finger protein, partial [Chloroflexi bacterium]|nr:B-box zinc finger protein [Chloroflexota bacterium]
MTETAERVSYCVRHPNVETNLRCSRCNELICPRCLVHTPVGARCPDCARLRVNPAFDVSGLALARAVSGAVAAATVAWVVYFYVLTVAGPIGYALWIFAPLGIGYAVAEAGYRAAGFRRHPRLQWVAGTAVVVGFAAGFLLASAFVP